LQSIPKSRSSPSTLVLLRPTCLTSSAPVAMFQLTPQSG
jgi:hypothetical protein